MIKKTDKIKFTVWYQLDGEIKKQAFSSFAAAAGCAEALKGKTDSSIYIKLNASNSDGSSQLSCDLYKYDKVTNIRECLKPHYAKMLAEMGV